MLHDKDPVLKIEHVSRCFPRDISNMPSAVLREMFLPRAFINSLRKNYSFALRDVNLSLFEGKKIGIIGAHRSGKTTLARISAGVLSPTEGSVFAKYPAILINKPTAGFKHSLTVLENLTLRASLIGVNGDSLKEVVDNALFRCGLSSLILNSQTGNVSLHLIKALGLSLMLELPTRILIVDETIAAGVGDQKLATLKQMEDKISSSTSLVFANNFSFLEGFVDQTYLLNRGSLLGPYELQDARRIFNQFSEKALYDNEVLDIYETEIDQNPDIDQYEETDQDINYLRNYKRQTKLLWGPLAELIKISVDGRDYSHSNYSLVVNPLDVIKLELTISIKKDCNVTMFLLELFSEVGESIGQSAIHGNDLYFSEDDTYVLSFCFTVPHELSASYGLGITPIEKFEKGELKNRLKILKFGINGKSQKSNQVLLQLENFNVEKKEIN
jgi:ABC-type polysaccharide/polyol phosphate transport system ATPase subunit